MWDNTDRAAAAAAVLKVYSKRLSARSHEGEGPETARRVAVREALATFCRQSGQSFIDELTEAIHDVIGDLLHVAEQRRLSRATVLRNGIESYVNPHPREMGWVDSIAQVDDVLHDPRILCLTDQLALALGDLVGDLLRQVEPSELSIAVVLWRAIDFFTFEMAEAAWEAPDDEAGEAKRDPDVAARAHAQKLLQETAALCATSERGLALVTQVSACFEHA